MANTPLYSRRRLLTTGATALSSIPFSPLLRAQEEAKELQLPNRAVTKGRIKQSVMGWCFNPMKAVELAKVCKALGMPAIEGIGSGDYPSVMELGLKIAIVGSHGFGNGPVTTDNHAKCKEAILKSIDLAAKIGSPNVITFTGMAETGISPEQGSKNCVALWKSVIGHAEKKGVNLCLEHLNSRDDTHPMKGHPGYFGDDVDHCADLIKQVGSPNMKLLFDIYHVQVMHGDVIRRLHGLKDIIGHYHTAGCPGRGEIDENQEINYPPIMRAILETGYEGYVAQEFIPTWPDKVDALRHAVALCDV
ncbi:TIM barrel protein [Verrucomicrobiales bacterium]|nr:TIM barrel protein [Verrucomicrobiales bacterium]MDB4808884.1 TIM barrel protein [Verrucomicrobiales bacterium]